MLLDADREFLLYGQLIRYICRYIEQIVTKVMGIA